MIRNKPVGRDSQLAIEIPAPEKDKPAWVKVGVIAAVGFVIGIAWPRLAGIRIGPNAPGESTAAASASHGGRAPDSPPASVTKPLGSASAAPVGSAMPTTTTSATSAAASGPPMVTVMKGLVLSCKTVDGDTKKGKDCGAVPGVDEIVRPRIRKIATCSGVEGQTGKFTLTANADFVSGRFNWDVNKASASVQNLDAIMSCLKTTFHNTATTATPHEHNRYTVVYTAELRPGNSVPDDDKSVAHHDKDKADPKAKDAPTDDKPAPAETAKPAALANGEAAIEFDVALVRDVPKTGTVQARLPRGTKVKVGASKEGWYQIKYGDNAASEGWVYRGAIGR